MEILHWLPVQPELARYFGSVIHGVATRASDTDVALLCQAKEAGEKLDTLTRYSKHLRNSPIVRLYSFKTQLIPAKRVPVLRITCNGQKVDLIVETQEERLINERFSAELLKCTDEAGKEEVQFLTCIMKVILDHHGYASASNQGLSGSSLLIMVIHFVRKWAKDGVLSELRSKRPSDLYGLLLFGFLQYYVLPERTRLSVIEASPNICSMKSQKGPAFHTPLAIQDPTEAGKYVAHAAQKWPAIMAVFRTISERLFYNMNNASIAIIGADLAKKYGLMIHRRKAAARCAGSLFWS